MHTYRIMRVADMFFWNRHGQLDCFLSDIADDGLFEDWILDLEIVHNLPAWTLEQIRKLRRRKQGGNL